MKNSEHALSDRLFREVNIKLAKQPPVVQSSAIDAASRVGLPQPWSNPHQKEETCRSKMLTKIFDKPLIAQKYLEILEPRNCIVTVEFLKERLATWSSHCG